MKSPELPASTLRALKGRWKGIGIQAVTKLPAPLQGARQMTPTVPVISSPANFCRASGAKRPKHFLEIYRRYQKPDREGGRAWINRALPHGLTFDKV
jgi:hypothetical protein